MKKLFWICGGVGFALVGYYVVLLYLIPPKHAETEISGYSIEMELVKLGPLPELTDKILTVRKGEKILARRTYRREGWDGRGMVPPCILSEMATNSLSLMHGDMGLSSIWVPA